MKKVKIEIICNEYAAYENGLISFLKTLKQLGSMGCSRNYYIDDYDIKGNKENSRFFFDGDGADRIYDINVYEGIKENE